jgi:hypothetical protein
MGQRSKLQGLSISLRTFLETRGRVANYVMCHFFTWENNYDLSRGKALESRGNTIISQKILFTVFLFTEKHTAAKEFIHPSQMQLLFHAPCKSLRTQWM